MSKQKSFFKEYVLNKKLIIRFKGRMIPANMSYQEQLNFQQSDHRNSNQGESQTYSKQNKTITFIKKTSITENDELTQNIKISGRATQLINRSITKRDIMMLKNMNLSKDELSFLQIQRKSIKQKNQKQYGNFILKTKKKQHESIDSKSFHKNRYQGVENHMVQHLKKQFKLNLQKCTEFEMKIFKYSQFLFLINLSNRIFRQFTNRYEKPLRFYVESGNNSNLIRQTMAKRFWWEQSNDKPIFIWTQIKKKSHFQGKPIKFSHYEKFPYIPILSRKTAIINEQQQFENKVALKILTKAQWNYIKNILSGTENKGFRQKAMKIHGNITFQQQKEAIAITNHIPLNNLLGNKKSLFLSLKLYYSLTKEFLWSSIPQTYHIRDLKDKDFEDFKKTFGNYSNKIWILKPGQYTNRGNGIIVINSIEQVTKIIKQHQKQQKREDRQKTFILQKYISNPLLYYKRKFDFRMYMLITTNNGILKAYWYHDGYIRTSGHFFNLSDLNNKYIHLTNDAVQKNSPYYGKYQKCNKLSLSEFQKYLDNNNHKLNLEDNVFPIMKKIAKDCIKSTSLYLNHCKRQNNFEIFGLDFMIDQYYNVFLIEINTNPCLQTSCCSILQKVIIHMIQNAFRIAVDPIFPPPMIFPNTKKYSTSQNAITSNNFELIFDELQESSKLKTLYKNNLAQLQRISISDLEKQVHQRFDTTD